MHTFDLLSGALCPTLAGFSYFDDPVYALRTSSSLVSPDRHSSSLGDYLSFSVSSFQTMFAE
jgi:hypothetical protein